MNIILIGTGRMGRLLRECALEAGDAVVGEYGRANIDELAAAPAADVAIDFSGPEALPAVAAYVARTGTPLVSGTTGYTAEEKAAVQAGYWFNFRYDPRKADKGENPFHLDSKAPSASYDDFIHGEVRYTSLERAFPERAKELFAEAEETAKEKYEHLVKLSETK